jgi:L-asparaginase II
VRDYAPIFELTRGVTVESVHFGSVAVVDSQGKLLAWYGNPETVTYLRSNAKPFQVLPFLEHGGQEYFHLTPQEIALMCASHAGTDEHVAVARSIQAKTGVSELELLCGVHPLDDQPTIEAMRSRSEPLTPNRHNCSGKHTGMLAYTRMLGPSADGQTYIDPHHPIQVQILNTLSEMCRIPVDQIGTGTDGCSAPNFAIPLKNAGWGYARLCEPEAGGVTPPERQAACHTISAAMTAHPDMVSGPGHFDTCLMEVTRGRMVSKGGAEGYQGIGLMPGALSPNSPAVGIALKISDGDARGKVRAAVALEVLNQLGALSSDEMAALSRFGPRFPVLNWRKLTVGEGRPIFQLNTLA